MSREHLLPVVHALHRTQHALEISPDKPGVASDCFRQPHFSNVISRQPDEHLRAGFHAGTVHLQPFDLRVCGRGRNLHCGFEPAGVRSDQVPVPPSGRPPRAGTDLWQRSDRAGVDGDSQPRGDGNVHGHRARASLH